MFTSLIRAWRERTSNPHCAAAGAKLHVTELEGRVNPSHAVDVPVAAAVPPAAAVGTPRWSPLPHTITRLPRPPARRHDSKSSSWKA